MWQWRNPHLPTKGVYELMDHYQVLQSPIVGPAVCFGQEKNGDIIGMAVGAKQGAICRVVIIYPEILER